MVHQQPGGSRSFRQRNILWIALGAALQAWIPAALTQPAPPEPSVAEIVSRMEVRNAQRALALRAYRSRRHYRVAYDGFAGHREAQMTVEAVYQAPNRKDFTIVSEAGSRLLEGRVLHRLLESEKEASAEATRRQVSLDSTNYDFTLVASEPTPHGPAFVLQVSPKRDNKFLYRGKIWVDARDYAVVRIEAEPAKNPSFWIKQTTIQHYYMKIGDFWLPEHNESVSRIRLGGRAVLTIDYQDYQITDAGHLGGDGSP